MSYELQASHKAYMIYFLKGWCIYWSYLKLPPVITCNTTATIYIPAASADAVKESNNMLSNVAGIKVSGKENEYIVVEVGSGEYHFSTPYNKSANGVSAMK